MDALIVMDHAGRVVDFNPAAEAMFGRTRTAVLNQPLAELIMPPASRKAHERGLAHLLATGVGRVVGQRVEMSAVRADGTEFPVELSIVRIRDSEPPLFTGFIRDISERKHFDQQIAELGDEERQRWGRELHDSLGQEMSGIGMLVALLKDELPNDSPQFSIVDQLQTNIEHTKQGLRRFAKGLFPVDVDAHGLRVALQELAKDISTIYPLTCRFECVDDVPLADNFTATQLFMIIREAVTNAAKHAQASEITIRLADEQGLCVSVRDNGTGLPDKLDETATMGLRIIKHRGNLIGATLQIETPPEGGTLISCRVRWEGEAPAEPRWTTDA